MKLSTKPSTKPPIKPFLLPMLCAALLLSNTAYSASGKVISRSFEVQDLSLLELEISVAELEIDIVDGNTVELEITLEAQRRFFGLREGNVDQVELTVREGDTSLFLGIDESNLEQHWVMSVPASLALQIELGVGGVQIEGLVNDLELDVGVGEVRVDAVEENFAEIQLQTGVGDATITGMRSRTENERSFVSADAYYQGNGEHSIQIDLGVGEIQVRKD